MNGACVPVVGRRIIWPGFAPAYEHVQGAWPARKLAGNPDSPQAVIFLASIIDVMMGS